MLEPFRNPKEDGIPEAGIGDPAKHFPGPGIPELERPAPVFFTAQVEAHPDHAVLGCVVVPAVEMSLAGDHPVNPPGETSDRPASRDLADRAKELEVVCQKIQKKKGAGTLLHAKLHADLLRMNPAVKARLRCLAAEASGEFRLEKLSQPDRVIFPEFPLQALEPSVFI